MQGWGGGVGRGRERKGVKGCVEGWLLRLHQVLQPCNHKPLGEGVCLEDWLLRKDSAQQLQQLLHLRNLAPTSWSAPRVEKRIGGRM